MSTPQCCIFCNLEPDDRRVSDALSPPIAIALNGNFETLLHSNAPPTPHDKTLVNGHLSDIQKGIDALDAAIDNLRRIRAKLEREQTKYTALVSPLRSFPPEILSHIFTLYNTNWWNSVVEWESEKELEQWEKVKRLLGNIKPKELEDWRLRPTRVLSQVCQSWRAITFACPSLWPYIYLPIFRSESELAAGQGLISDQLVHSSIRPLRIRSSFPWPFLGQSLWDGHHRLLSQHILPAHRKWMSIKLTLTHELFPLFSRLSGESPMYPSLVSLSIISPHCSGNDESIWTISSTDAPHLREVSLQWISDVQQFQLPWAQLRKLRLSGCEGDRAFIIVQQLRDVEELELVGVEYEENPNFSRTPVALSSLRCLKISDVGIEESGAARILPALRPSALETIIWTQMCDKDKTLVDMMFKRTWPNGDHTLKELHLQSPIFASKKTPLVSLLDSIRSSVEVISIGYPSYFDSDFICLSTLLSNFLKDKPAPKLRSFGLKGVQLDVYAIKSIVDCLQEHDIEVHLLNCTFGAMVWHEGANLLSTLGGLQKSPPKKGRLFLDIACPDSKFIVYSPQSGLSMEDRG